jgi:hypothetical protein
MEHKFAGDFIAFDFLNLVSCRDRFALQSAKHKESVGDTFFVTH